MNGTQNLSAPLAWAALVARFEPDTTTVEAQHGPTVVAVIDEPTLEIITHDLEIERWEAASDFLGLAIEEMLAQGEREYRQATLDEAIAEVLAVQIDEPKAKAKPRCATHGVWAREDDGRCKRCDEPEVERVVPEPPVTFGASFERFGATFEPSQDGRYAIATCACKHKASGPLEMVLEAIEDHAGECSKVRKARKVAPGNPKPVEATPKTTKKAPEPKVDPEGDEALRLLVEALKVVKPTKVAQQVDTSGPAKLVLGVRGNGMLARRSAHELAKATGLAQRDLAKMTADEARVLTTQHGIEADWIAAKDL